MINIQSIENSNVNILKVSFYKEHVLIFFYCYSYFYKNFFKDLSFFERMVIVRFYVNVYLFSRLQLKDLYNDPLKKQQFIEGFLSNHFFFLTNLNFIFFENENLNEIRDTILFYKNKINVFYDINKMDFLYNVLYQFFSFFSSDDFVNFSYFNAFLVNFRNFFVSNNRMMLCYLFDDHVRVCKV